MSERTHSGAVEIPKIEGSASVRDVLEDAQQRVDSANDIADTILSLILPPEPRPVATDEDKNPDRNPLSVRARQLAVQAGALQERLRRIVELIG